MCAVTTAVGLALVALVHPRGWCTVCPMGTMQALIGGRRGARPRIDKTLCRMCKKCERACPMWLPITNYREDGVMRDPDCLRCSECVAACPFDALR
jgi:polyferredoxin